MTHMPAAFAKLLPVQPDLLDLPRLDTRIILALRIAVISNSAWQDGKQFIRQRLGCDKATTRFLIMVETMAQAWPENFRIGRPCCRQTTADEILMLSMLHLAARGNRPAFDSLIREMIDQSGRDRIYQDMASFAAIYDQLSADIR